jgi:myo-inositol 2-dehydrogenase/D-chiro-inositol 1-dehydrogenase
MIGFCIVGAGRIGKLHAANVAQHPGARIVAVVDAVMEAAEGLARCHGAVPETDFETALGMPGVDAVIIGAPTSMHVDLILLAARHGKAILCEKPIDLDIKRVDACLAEIAKYKVKFAVGFNRRFDPTISKLKKAMDRGDVGAPELIIITSRDPAPPPIEYVRTSGGYFRDSTIHDLDLARWLLGEEPVEVSAFGSNLVDPAIKAAGDFDTAGTMLRTASGKICIINNSRRAVYGFDQRVEVFGSKGMLQTENQRDSGLLRWNETETAAQDRLKLFFLERYERSFQAELSEFIAAVEGKGELSVTGEDGRRALMLADAAQHAASKGVVVRL